MLRPATLCLVLLLTPAAIGSAFAQSGGAQGRDRGAALYDLHCSACHTAQVHWRDTRLATDWSTLRAQVRRWQGNQNLGWNEPDIDAVTRYLNGLYYRYPAQEAPLSALMPR